MEEAKKPCADFAITEPPLCVLTPIDGGYMWPCVDFSDPDYPEGSDEVLSVTFQTVEQAAFFKEKFEAAQAFNMDA